jgi:hypothetical protein
MRPRQELYDRMPLGIKTGKGREKVIKEKVVGRRNTVDHSTRTATEVVQSP